MASFLRVVSCNVASYTGNGCVTVDLAGGAALPPDIIALVRCPTPRRVSRPAGFRSLGAMNDHHSGDFVELLAREDLSAQIISLDVSFISLPAVAACVTLNDGMDSSELASLASGGWTNASAGHEGGGSDQSCIFRCKDEEVDATRYSILAYGESSFGIDVQLQVMTQTPFNLPAENRIRPCRPRRGFVGRSRFMLQAAKKPNG
ncbi:hypothetical protein THAOC_04476 [Thalassiosira oceanica]|uniref:Uncharacterized protein n=1 Tax=Thalassiosira oceanica TaxID=159749 RepID=K0T9V4_THAOC|nr:hypothetical protein THAOC_04476 [Thalassiosira oceanica]|eukprot:EJK73879.1 hypothetical protein THAOC_04476 [Thalassiosira oceanica]